MILTIIVYLCLCMQLLHTASKKYLTVNTAETSRTENTNLRVSSYMHCVINIAVIRNLLNDYRLNCLQRTLSVVSLRFCHVIRCVQWEMEYVTMIRSSLRVSRQRDNSCTVQVIATRTNSMYWNNGSCICMTSFECFPLIMISNNSYELNLSATESALTIIPHYRPMPSHDPKAFRVSEATQLQYIMHIAIIILCLLV